ncbi:MAG: hypothetical protein K9N35_09665 [Candidatus Marinimicrobia bacterium]|nr:hypothetical protein [Candidatus Neomarinimicrobiota bacterium]
MLVAVIMAFVVLSFTGVAVLDVAYNSKSTSLETVANIKVQYIVESEINEALWLINTGTDSLVNTSADGITTSWDSDTHVLTVSVDTLNVSSEIAIDLDNDTHFDRGFASKNDIESHGYSYTTNENHSSRKFKFMPDVDLQYFINNAVNIEHGNDNSWNAAEITEEGIHIFTGNNLVVENINLSNSTLVFTGKNITISNNFISAPTPSIYENTLPALIFTDTEYPVTISAGNTISGTIYSVGQLNLENASITGPVVGDIISLLEDVTLVDDETYYGWAAGFGDVDSYDWPKQIGRWTTTKWGKTGTI